MVFLPIELPIEIESLLNQWLSDIPPLRSSSVDVPNSAPLQLLLTVVSACSM